MATVALLTEQLGDCLARLANRAVTSLTNHRTLLSDLPTVIGRGELRVAGVGRSDFSEANSEVNLGSIREGDNCDPLHVAHT